MKSGAWHQIYEKRYSISLGSSHQFENRQKFVMNLAWQKAAAPMESNIFQHSIPSFNQKALKSIIADPNPGTYLGIYNT